MLVRKELSCSIHTVAQQTFKDIFKKNYKQNNVMIKNPNISLFDHYLDSENIHLNFKSTVF